MKIDLDGLQDTDPNQTYQIQIDLRGRVRLGVTPPRNTCDELNPICNPIELNLSISAGIGFKPGGHPGKPPGTPPSLPRRPIGFRPGGHPGVPPGAPPANPSSPNPIGFKLGGGAAFVETTAGGIAVTVLAGIAAVGAVALATEETKRALRGEKTMAAEAVDYWAEVQEAAVAEDPSVGGALKYVGAEIAGGLAGFIASGQKNLWGLF